MVKKKKEEVADKQEKKDLIESASIDSFPASDAPAWTGVTAKVQCGEIPKDKK